MFFAAGGPSQTMTLTFYSDGPFSRTDHPRVEGHSASQNGLLLLFVLGLVVQLCPVSSQAQTAQLLVQTNVERAAVDIDGTQVGKTNTDGEILIEDLSPGSHTVELRKRGYWNASTRVTLEEGLTNSVTLELTARNVRGAGVLVRTNVSDALVLLDGEQKGQTGSDGQVYLANVQVGEHQLSVRKEGYDPVFRTITITDEQLDRNIRLRLSPTASSPTAEGDEVVPSTDTTASEPMSTTAKLVVSTNVAQADVYLDGAFRGRTKGNGSLALTADSGEYQVTVKKEGFVDVQKTARLQAEERETIKVVLEEASFLPISGYTLSLVLAALLASLVGALAVVVILYFREGGSLGVGSQSNAFDRYRLLDVFDTDGITSRHLANDPVEGKQVVLRMLDEVYSGDPEIVQAFLKQGQRLKEITESNPEAPVVNAYRYGREKDWGQGRPFIAHEYVQGERLSTFLREHGTLNVRPALVIIQQVCEGLQAAHSHHLWHQNLTPENLIVTQARSQVRVKLVNFRVGEREEVLQEADGGTTLQDPAYMAPEQCRNEAVDGSVDVYAAGILFHVLVTGSTPFQDDNPSKIMEMHETAPRPQLPNDTPSYVGPLFQRMLSKDPEDRPDASNIVAIIDLVQATT